MNKLVRTFSKAYQIALRFYPTRFQETYSEEMASVFHEACQNKSLESNLSVLKLGLFELQELPKNVIKEHMSEIWRSSVQNQIHTPEPFTRSIVRGILAFCFGFFAIYFTYCLIDTVINPGNTIYQGKSLWNDFTFIHPTALAYSLSAGVMGIVYGKKRAIGSAITAFMIYTLLFQILETIYRISGYVIPVPLGTFMPYIFSTIAGGFVCGAIGLILHGWKGTGWYAVAGMIGFNFGFIVNKAVALFIIRNSPYNYNLENLRVGNLWYFAYFIIPALFYALSVGVLLGIVSIDFKNLTARRQEIPAG